MHGFARALAAPVAGGLCSRLFGGLAPGVRRLPWCDRLTIAAFVAAAAALLDGCAATASRSAASADVLPAQDNATAKWMVEQEKAWAEMACGGRSVVAVFADDFHGTSPKGARYGKPADEAPDPKTQWSTDCRLDSAEVRFFSADVAVVYGSESKTVALADARSERRCLVWSDVWLRRKQRWQIIAAQDNRIDCPAR
jgi:hypothetical protein